MTRSQPLAPPSGAAQTGRGRRRPGPHGLLERPGVAVLPILLLSLCLASCAGDDAPTPTQAVQPVAAAPVQAAARNGFTQVTAAWGEGFLARDPVKGKTLLYVSGTHYEMGFQTGFLAAADTARMVHDYCNEFLFEMLELPMSSGDLGPLWEWVRAWLKDLTLASLHYVPAPLVEEMNGIADGYALAREQGHPGTERPVEFADVLLLNQAMDVLSSLAYNVLGQSVLACNQFACWGGMTQDGRLLHGRDFQFYNAGVYQDTALLAVAVPRDASGEAAAGHPFTAITAPGFVGLATGLNAQGISMGIDVVHAWPARPADPGLGGLLLIRWIMEQASTLEEAVRIVRESERGCPWIYLVADGKTSDAVVLEAIRSDALEPWMDDRYAENLATAEKILGAPLTPYLPDRGLHVRTADYVMDEAVRGKALYPDNPSSGYRNNPKFPDNRTVLNYNFPDPLEDRPDLIVVTNLFLTPGMRPYQWAPWVSLVWKTYWPSAEWRYAAQTELLLDRAARDAALDWEAAWSIANFLDPATDEGAFFHGPGRTQAVSGHVALVDGRERVLRGLFGYYDHPWVQLDLRDFLP